MNDPRLHTEGAEKTFTHEVLTYWTFTHSYLTSDIRLERETTNQL